MHKPSQPKTLSDWIVLAIVSSLPALIGIGVAIVLAMAAWQHVASRFVGALHGVH